MNYIQQKVKVFFKTGYVAEGTVEEWGEIIALFTNAGDRLIIFNPNENILMIQIFGQNSLPVSSPVPNSELPPPIWAHEEKIDKVIEVRKQQLGEHRSKLTQFMRQNNQAAPVKYGK